MELQLVTTTAGEPLSLSKVKTYLRQTSEADDQLISELITSARLKAESVTGHSLVAHTYKLQVNEHDGRIYLLMPPIGTVTSVQYYSNYAWTTLTANSDYVVMGLQNKYIDISTDYQDLLIEYSTTAYSNMELNMLMMDLVSVMYDNRPNNKAEVDAIVRKMLSHKVWRAE